MRKLMGYELRKLFGRRLTQAALLAAVLFSALFTVSTYQNKYASYGGLRRHIALTDPSHKAC